MSEQQALSFLVGLLFDRDNPITPICELSGGERARLQVSLLILSCANLRILDEPTNNLDIRSFEVLESALLDFPGAILTISHDRFFLDRICTRIIEVNSGVVTSFPGGYSYYIDNPDKGTPLTGGMQYPKPEPASTGKQRKARR